MLKNMGNSVVQHYLHEANGVVAFFSRLESRLAQLGNIHFLHSPPVEAAVQLQKDINDVLCKWLVS